MANSECCNITAVKDINNFFINLILRNWNNGEHFEKMKVIGYNTVSRAS